jgi:hypothetical protein
MRLLLLAVKQGTNVLFCMPNRTELSHWSQLWMGLVVRAASPVKQGPIVLFCTPMHPIGLNYGWAWSFALRAQSSRDQLSYSARQAGSKASYWSQLWMGLVVRAASVNLRQRHAHGA